MAQPTLPGLTLKHRGGDWYEHAVLVTNWVERDVLAVAQIYRDRAGAENLFDELKNQWGWTGFTTQDLKRSQLMAWIVALQLVEQLCPTGHCFARKPSSNPHNPQDLLTA